jgi:GrpB-like predicted nucleotidyltransferase (UPF0157 family)
MEIDKNQKRKYEISQHHPDWIEMYSGLKTQVEKIFKDEEFLIEHIGSTSIPGMRAKPVIDICLSVPEMKEFEKEIAQMERLGFQWEKDYVAPNTMIFFKTKENSDEKIAQIHLCKKGSYKEKQFIDMRDYMRAHPEVVEEYSNLKMKLNNKFPDNYPAYRKGKDDFLKEMEQKAYKWKELQN